MHGQQKFIYIYIYNISRLTGENSEEYSAGHVEDIISYKPLIDWTPLWN
jgi:hypothetical protein